MFVQSQKRPVSSLLEWVCFWGRSGKHLPQKPCTLAQRLDRMGADEGDLVVTARWGAFALVIMRGRFWAAGITV